MKQNVRRFLFLACSDTVILFSSLLITLIVRQRFIVHRDFIEEHIVAFLPLFSIWLITFYAEGLYDLGARQDIVNQLSEFIVTGGINCAIGISYFYFTTPYLSLTPKTHFIVTVILSHILILAWRRYCSILFGAGRFSQRIGICADEDILLDLASNIRTNPMLGLVPITTEFESANFIVADKQWIDAHPSDARAIMAISLHNRIPIISLEHFYERFFDKVAPEHIADHSFWMLENVMPQMMGSYFHAKRIVDILLSTCLLLLLFPLLTAIAAIMLISSGTDVFFSQERTGYLGRKFKLWKFRTMNHSPNPQPFSSLDEVESRVTPFGKWLRRFRLDELPQLWNVLKGDMSLVGPRPEWTQEVRILEQTIPNYHLRHLARPGITGWAQVHFRATNSIDDSLEKLRYDLYYIKHFSLAVDIGILLKTLKRVMIRDSFVSVGSDFPEKSDNKDLVAGSKNMDIAARSKNGPPASPLTNNIHALFIHH